MIKEKNRRDQASIWFLWILFFICILCISYRQLRDSGKKTEIAPLSKMSHPLNAFQITVFEEGLEKSIRDSHSSSYASLSQGGSLEGWVRGRLATEAFRRKETCDVNASTIGLARWKTWTPALWKRLEWLQSHGFQAVWNNKSKTYLDRSFQVIYPTGEEPTPVPQTDANVGKKSPIDLGSFERDLTRCSSQTLRRFWIEAILEIQGDHLDFEKLILDTSPGRSCPKEWIELIQEQMELELKTTSLKQENSQNIDKISFLLIWQFFCHYPVEKGA